METNYVLHPVCDVFQEHLYQRNYCTYCLLCVTDLGMALTPLLNMEPFHQEVEVGENEENTMPSFTITILAGREEAGKTPLLDTSNTVRRQGEQDSQATAHSNINNKTFPPQA